MKFVKQNFQSKSELRRLMRHQRIQQGELMDRRASEIISKNLLDYVHTRSEIDLLLGFFPTEYEPQIIDALVSVKSHMKVALPRVEPDSLGMEFFLWRDDQSLTQNMWGIPEPPPQQSILIDERSLILIPGLAFDLRGNRLGHGKGYYDCFLARFPKLNKLAVVYDYQIFSKIPFEEHDIPVDAILTESGIRHPHKGLL